MENELDELFVCAFQQGYGFELDRWMSIDYKIYSRLREIYETEFKK